MKRKVNRVGTSTLTVSIPSKWARKYNISPGDELEVEEDKNKLNICTENIKEKTTNILIDVSNQKNMIHRIVAAAYKSGKKNLTIQYERAEELKIIQKRIERNLPEFDAIEYDENKVKIKSIASLDPEKFNIILKKVFFSLEMTIKNIQKEIKTKDFEGLKSTALMDKNIDKYTDFCRRLLNKNIESPYNSNSVYYILEEIEIIGDIYKSLCKEIAKNKINLSKELRNLLNETNEFLLDFNNLFFNFNYQKLKKFGEKKEKLDKKINQLYSKVKRKELKAFFLITQIFNATFEMKGALLTHFIEWVIL
ncbi:AbrB/MazE/SpoVT family DNA-binding domain-containing protein [archaeon]|jgi:phosphate uptake regulator|nr:AbrB/MazE/SpoVT family DNA-binding domain-containing protein [archaeon]MBT4397334.1 AbrB/MazE/SpoVT family DNA-binding domain-containing protein [archaeon]MBT4440714.1 AbrB/MazE/SpoVT family DNA-binding domain-containing protein [archaeon]